MGWFAWLSNTNIENALNDIGESLQSLHTKVNIIMAQVSVEQDVLDTIGTELGAIGDAVQALVDNPGNPLTAADLTVITDPLARIQDILPHPELQ